MAVLCLSTLWACDVQVKMTDTGRSGMWDSALQQVYADKSWAASGSVQLSGEELAGRADRLLTCNMAHMADQNAVSVNTVKHMTSVLKVGGVMCSGSLC